MGQPKTFLADICDFAFLRGAESLEVKFDDDRLFVYARSGGTSVSIVSYKRSCSEAGELLDDLYSAARKPANAMIAGHPSILHVKTRENFGEHAFEVTMQPASSSVAAGTWKFTAKQGQYLAYIYHYTKVHQRPPSESDIQRRFGVSPPSIHNMILTLERNALIERTPGAARSIRVLVPPEKLPPLN